MKPQIKLNDFTDNLKKNMKIAFKRLDKNVYILDKLLLKEVEEDFGKRLYNYNWKNFLH